MYSALRSESTSFEDRARGDGPENVGLKEGCKEQGEEFKRANVQSREVERRGWGCESETEEQVRITEDLPDEPALYSSMVIS